MGVGRARSALRGETNTRKTNRLRLAISCVVAHASWLGLWLAHVVDTRVRRLSAVLVDGARAVGGRKTKTRRAGRARNRTIGRIITGFSRGSFDGAFSVDARLGSVGALAVVITSISSSWTHYTRTSDAHVGEALRVRQADRGWLRRRCFKECGEHKDESEQQCCFVSS